MRKTSYVDSQFVVCVQKYLQLHYSLARYSNAGLDTLENLTALFCPKTCVLRKNEKEAVMSMDKKGPKPHEGSELAQIWGQIRTQNV